ncbi:unnamed protein product, partial [Adineta steineri]
MNSLGDTDIGGSGASSSFSRIGMYTQHILDRVTPFVSLRWITNFILLIIFFLRIFFAQ